MGTKNTTTQYERLSHRRKQLQEDGLAPDWYTTAGYQLVTSKNYLDTGETPFDMYRRVADRAAELITVDIPIEYGYETWDKAFFDVIWKGWLSPSTPVLINMGNNRGHPVACSGTNVLDNIRDFYVARTEIAQLTQRGYGTSVCLDPIRPRGSSISTGGTANGAMQMVEGLVQDMFQVSQGNSRRGSVGIYMDLLHGDADELCERLLADDEGLNVGWNVTDEFEELFTRNPSEGDRIWKRSLKTKMTKGKGYFFFKDKVNRRRPKMYVDKGFYVRHSNLCSEIHLMNDKDHSFTCVLSSVNISKYDEWKDTKLFQIAAVFLDTIIDDMLIKAKTEVGFERVVAFTEKSRAIGLGVLGLSTYYQQQSWVFGGLQSRMFNKTFFKDMNTETLEASRFMAEAVGEPEWLEGYKERWSHRLALPPTMSTSIIIGGVSQGIEPVFANVFEQDTAGGTVYRINPPLLELMKARGQYNEATMRRIAEDQGSVQAETWLTRDERAIFLTAFEVNQEFILDMAADRQPDVDQGQSINLYFTAREKEEEISRLHNLAFVNPDILGLYYVRSLNGTAKVIVDKDECVACHG